MSKQVLRPLSLLAMLRLEANERERLGSDGGAPLVTLLRDAADKIEYLELSIESVQRELSKRD